MSDRIAVMDDGVVQQCGPPEEIYEQPGEAFVAGFIGISNLLPGDRRERRRAAGDRRATSPHRCPTDWPTGPTVQLSVRPEKIWLDELEEGMASGRGHGRRARLRRHDHAGDRRARAGRAARRARAEHVARARRRPLGDRRPRRARLAPRARAGPALRRPTSSSSAPGSAPSALPGGQGARAALTWRFNVWYGGVQVELNPHRQAASVPRAADSSASQGRTRTAAGVADVARMSYVDERSQSDARVTCDFLRESGGSSTGTGCRPAQGRPWRTSTFRRALRPRGSCSGTEGPDGAGYPLRKRGANPTLAPTDSWVPRYRAAEGCIARSRDVRTYVVGASTRRPPRLDPREPRRCEALHVKYGRAGGRARGRWRRSPAGARLLPAARRCETRCCGSGSPWTAGAPPPRVRWRETLPASRLGRGGQPPPRCSTSPARGPARWPGCGRGPALGLGPPARWPRPST